MYPGLTSSPLAQYLATRSAIPKVVGVLAMIFASLGAMASAIWTWGPLDDLGRWGHDGEWHQVSQWLLAWGVLSGVVFVVHLIGGLMAMMYRPSAPRWITIYAFAALVLALADGAVVVLFAPDAGGRHYHGLYESIVIMHLVFTGLALPWPVTAALLMNTARAKRACVIPPG